MLDRRTSTVRYPLFGLTLLILLGVTFLVACGPEAPAAAPTSAPATEEVAAAPPTEAPTEEPTVAPTEEPTEAPTEEPTAAPTEEPTAAPTEEPTAAPTEEPTAAPTEEPTPAANLYKGAPQGVDEQGVPILGDPNAPVRLIDYSDFACPTCQRYVLTVEPSIIERYVVDGQVRLSFRPVLNHGDRSLITSTASVCALQQGQFWPMHEQLFTGLQEMFNTPVDGLPALMSSYASQLGLDQQAFDACMTQGDAQAQVIAWDAEQRQRGITVQPTFEVQNERFVGFRPYDVFQQLIEGALVEG